MHDYHDLRTGVLAASPAKRAPGYTSLDSSDLSAPQPAHHVSGRPERSASLQRLAQ
jgi:hypothetical protein